jgi:Domain of unknown function (DUF5916)
MRMIAIDFALLMTAWPAAAQMAARDSGYPVDPLSLPRPTLRAERTAEEIHVDGHLDEAAWATADSSTTAFIQVTPSPGYPATERTIVRILYDDHNLYIGATLFESEPGRLVTPGLEQDYDTQSSDMFAVALDTYHDMQNGFVFAINPAGAVWDAQTFNDQRDIIPAWEGIIDVRTSVGDDRWTVELAIPFNTLRYNPSDGEQTWGLAFSRRIRHRNEDSNWSPTPRQFRLYKFSLAGTLTGLEGLRPGRNLWIKPWVLGDRLTGVTHPGNENNADAGLDLKWGVTPRLTLDLTTNTDFSQVEVDAEQVNLTRFSLFFPEKRDFFLENEGTFAFQDVTIRNYRTGSSARNFTLFHSRTIGLSPSRTALPIAGGARLTGKLGERLEIGILDMQTRNDGSLAAGDLNPAENFAVARVKAQVLGSSSVGAMFLNREQTGNLAEPTFNRSWGVDGNFNIRNLVLSTYFAGTAESDSTGNSRSAAMIQAAWRNPLWDVSVLAKHVGDDFNPGLGFVDRTGIRRLYATVGAHPQPRTRRIVEINPYVDVDFYSNLNGDLETRILSPTVTVQFSDGGMLSIDANDHFERLFEPATIAGAAIDAGRYEWRDITTSYAVPGSHKLSGRLSLSRGGFYDGSRTSVTASTRFRPDPHLTLDLAAQHNDLELGGNAFTADLYSARVRFAANVRTFLMGFVQYNQASDEIISNVRFNLIHAPLSDLFVVFTERRSLANDVAEPVLERGITLKVTRLVAF